jgi:uncharacterized protein YndB with AHSA1/START domain
MTEQGAAKDRIVSECDLPHPPEKVWRALTVPELLGEWLMPNEIVPEAGHRFAFEGGAHDPTVECEVLEAEPNQLLRLAWRETAPGMGGSLESVVTFALTRTGSGGTHLRIVHDCFARVGRMPAVAMSGAGANLRWNARRDLPLAANGPFLSLAA